MLPASGVWTVIPESAMVANLKGFKGLAQITTVLFSLQGA